MQMLYVMGAELRAKGVEAVTLLGDLADPATPLALVELAKTTYGRLVILVANAGLFIKFLIPAATPGAPVCNPCLPLGVVTSTRNFTLDQAGFRLKHNEQF